jgi:hypothetical protein
VGGLYFVTSSEEDCKPLLETFSTDEEFRGSRTLAFTKSGGIKLNGLPYRRLCAPVQCVILCGPHGVKKVNGCATCACNP